MVAKVGIGLAVSALSSVVTGVTSFMAAQAQAAINEMNAQIADDNAKRAIERSQIEQQESDFITSVLLGEQLAQQGASGVDVGRGSPRLTRISARELGRKDALNIRQSGEIEAYNFRASAASQRAQGSLTKQGGAFGLLSSFLNAGSTITRARGAPPQYFAPVPRSRPRILV